MEKRTLRRTKKRRNSTDFETDLLTKNDGVEQEGEHEQSAVTNSGQPAQGNSQVCQPPKRRKLQNGKTSGTAKDCVSEGVSSKTDSTLKRKSFLEKNKIKSSISNLQGNLRPQVVTTTALANVRKQLPVNLKDLKAFCDSVNSVSVSFLTDHLQTLKCLSLYLKSAQKAKKDTCAASN